MTENNSLRSWYIGHAWRLLSGRGENITHTHINSGDTFGAMKIELGSILLSTTHATIFNSTSNKTGMQHFPFYRFLNGSHRSIVLIPSVQIIANRRTPV